MSGSGKDDPKDNHKETLWVEEVENVTPLKGDGKKKPAQPSLRGRPRPIRPADTTPGPKGPRHQVAFDPNLYNKLSTGKVSIEAKLDLHGVTEADAHQRLVGMIEAAWHDGRRRLLVVTGKGRGGTSAIRAALPQWLSSPGLTPYVISFDYAAQRHGGDGAVYVLLRRQP